MAYFITDTCIGCGSCMKVCPSDAIQGEKKQIHRIDADLCVECGTCGKVCPKGCVEDAFGEIALRVKKTEWQKPVFDEKMCMACGICIDACLVGCLMISETGTKKDPNGYPLLADPQACIGCGFCANDCPVEAIEMAVPEPVL